MDSRLLSFWVWLVSLLGMVAAAVVSLDAWSDAAAWVYRLASVAFIVSFGAWTGLRMVSRSAPRAGGAASIKKSSRMQAGFIVALGATWLATVGLIFTYSGFGRFRGPGLPAVLPHQLAGLWFLLLLLTLVLLAFLALERPRRVALSK